MLCSNCGSKIPFTGRVCPHCKQKKGGDQVVVGLAVVLGLGGGYLAWDSGVAATVIGLICGVFVAVIVGGFVSAKKETDDTKGENPAPRREPPVYHADVLDRLERLQALRLTGAIDDAEFAFHKRGLLQVPPDAPRRRADASIIQDRQAPPARFSRAAIGGTLGFVILTFFVGGIGFAAISMTKGAATQGPTNSVAEVAPAVAAPTVSKPLPSNPTKRNLPPMLGSSAGRSSDGVSESTPAVPAATEVQPSEAAKRSAWPVQASSTEAKQITTAALGCVDKDDANTAFSLIVAQDKAAFGRYAMTKALSGDCLAMESGTQVSLADISLMSGMACVRPAGDYRCYWVPSHSVSK